MRETMWGDEIAKNSFCFNGLNLWCARRDSNPHDFTHCHLKAARLPIPPRALGKPAPDVRRTGSTARDVTNQGWGDKACRCGQSGEVGIGFRPTGCPAISAAFA